MMFSIIEHIEYLITHHDCVAVPGWGAFIANYSNAHYDEDSCVFSRPLRTIGFNSSVIYNDGLLVQSIMKREQLSYDDTMRFIADSVTAFRQQLAMNCEVSMGRLGFFRSNEDDHIEFVPFFHGNASDQFFGLTDMEIKTVSTLEAELQSEAAPASESTVILPKRQNLFSRRASKIAASVVVLLGLGIMLSTTNIVDRSRHDMASMAPEISAPQPQQLGTTVQQGVVAQSPQVIAQHPAIESVGNTTGKYYMVIATLRNQQELDAFKSKYASLVPYMKLLDYKGLTCVYVARSDDYAKLMSLRDQLPERLRDVWIYN